MCKPSTGVHIGEYNLLSCWLDVVIDQVNLLEDQVRSVGEVVFYLGSKPHWVVNSHNELNNSLKVLEILSFEVVLAHPQLQEHVGSC